MIYCWYCGVYFHMDSGLLLFCVSVCAYSMVPHMFERGDPLILLFFFFFIFSFSQAFILDITSTFCAMLYVFILFLILGTKENKCACNIRKQESNTTNTLFQAIQVWFSSFHYFIDLEESEQMKCSHILTIWLFTQKTTQRAVKTFSRRRRAASWGMRAGHHLLRMHTVLVRISRSGGGGRGGRGGWGGLSASTAPPENSSRI